MNLPTVGNRPVCQERTLVFKTQHYELDKSLTDQASQTLTAHWIFQNRRLIHPSVNILASFLWLVDMWYMTHSMYLHTERHKYTCTCTHNTHSYMHIIQTCIHIHTHIQNVHTRTNMHTDFLNEVKKPYYTDPIQISVNNQASSLLNLLVLLWPGLIGCAYSIIAMSCWFNWLSLLSPGPAHDCPKYIWPSIINYKIDVVAGPVS